MKEIMRTARSLISKTVKNIALLKGCSRQSFLQHQAVSNAAANGLKRAQPELSVLRNASYWRRYCSSSEYYVQPEKEREETFYADRERRHKKREAELERLYLNASTIYVAFVMDVTGSMKRWIQGVARHISALATQVNDTYGPGDEMNGSQKRDVYFAFVGYRDYGDKPEVEQLDFTSVDQFKEYLSNVKAYGGGADAWGYGAEDVLSGLEHVARLNWGNDTNTARVIIHIGDRPCHGKKYNLGHVPDSHPEGDKYHRQPGQLLAKLANDVHIDTYLFQHIEQYTEPMVAAFRQELENAGVDSDWMRDQVVGSDDQVMAQAATVIYDSVSRSFTRSVTSQQHHRMPRGFKIDTRHPDHIDWSTIPAKSGIFMACDLPSSIEELRSLIAKNYPLHYNPEVGGLKVAPQPFSAEGKTRLPYHARAIGLDGKEDPATLVAKLFRDAHPDANTFARGMEVIEANTIAEYLASEFSKLLPQGQPQLMYMQSKLFLELGQDAPLDTKDVWVAMVEAAVEESLRGLPVVRFSNNFGYTRPDARHAELIAAFSHWTHDVTGGALMVVDCEGLYQEGDNTIVLLDPAVLCPSDLTRFGSTNLGGAGIRTCFASHKCNWLCRLLGLTKSPTTV